MQANASMRQPARLGFLLPLLLMAGCFGTGEGPTPILGTPAPPPPPVTCDSVNFEDGCGPYVFNEFEGGPATVVNNPAKGGINTSDKVARMQKFAAEVYGGSTLDVGGNFNFGQGEAFKVKVRASRAVPMLFKFEGLNRERTLNYSGGGGWQELCFDFTGDLFNSVNRLLNSLGGITVTAPVACAQQRRGQQKHKNGGNAEMESVSVHDVIPSILMDCVVHCGC